MRIRVLSALCVAAGALGLLGVASASAATAPQPAKAHAAVFLKDLYKVGSSEVTVTNRNIMVHGVVRPYVPGQAVTVELMQNSKVFQTKHLILKASPKKVYGGFLIRAKTPHAGPVTVKVVHQRSAKQVSFVTLAHWTVLAEDTSSKPFMDLVQNRLGELHVFVPHTGVLDSGTELALDAYHRLLGEGEGHIQVDAATVTDLLDGKGAFHVKYPEQGHHAEGDLSDQVLALTDGSKVQMLFPISSGKPSTPTILGNYQVYRKQPGYLPDGMYYSAFFIRGYAIHGYDPAPAYPASHGCMRLPIADAITAFDWIDMGDWVDTYYT